MECCSGKDSLRQNGFFLSWQWPLGEISCRPRSPWRSRRPRWPRRRTRRRRRGRLLRPRGCLLEDTASAPALASSRSAGRASSRLRPRPSGASPCHPPYSSRPPAQVGSSEDRMKRMRMARADCCFQLSPWWMVSGRRSGTKRWAC